MSRSLSHRFRRVPNPTLSDQEFIIKTESCSIYHSGMKPMIIVPISAFALGLAGCQDNRVPTLEKRIADLESKVKTIGENQQAKVDAASTNEARFKQCVYGADDEFDNALRLNGTKNPNGSYAVPTSSLQQLQRQKQNKLEECKLLYK
jgi:hypothetical protein